MTPSASVSSRTWPWARTRRAAGALTAVALALFLPATAALATQGGIPSPDPSEQFAPDPAPSGGQPATAGGKASPPSQPSQPSQPVTPPAARAPAPPVTRIAAPDTTAPSRATASGAPAKQHVRHRHHRAVTAASAPARPHATSHRAHALTRPFVATLRLAFAPPAKSIEAAGGPPDALALAALALILLVVTGLLVVRASSQLLRRERPT